LPFPPCRLRHWWPTRELDNEAEHRLPHRTTRAGDADRRRDAPWLVSFAVWANVLQYLGSQITVAELRARARTARLLLDELRRWGYVTLTPPVGETLKKPPQDGTLVRATEGGRQARGSSSSSLRSSTTAGELASARWRAGVRQRRATLPHYPMVLHRGGYPDGS
jgi:hypothetical protein